MGLNVATEPVVEPPKNADGKYDWERINPDLAQANKFDFQGHLRAQGRGVMEMLQKAQREHPAVQQGDGKPKQCRLFKVKTDGTKEWVTVNAPYWTTFNNIRELNGYDTIQHYTKRGWTEEEPFKINDDPKDARIRELEKAMNERTSGDKRLTELEEANKELAAKLDALLKQGAKK